MGNPFTDESRDARFKVDVAGFCDTLRSPESLHRLVMVEKPAVLSSGDFALKSMLDALIDGHKVRGDYRAIQRLLGALFGELVPDAPAKVPTGTPGAERHGKR